jgi:hypothetical protein
MMGLSNLNATHLSSAKITAANDAISALETAIEEININLSTEDRRRYGSINEQNKLFVNKVYDYNQSQANLSSPEVDWEEFAKDHTSRKNMETMISKLESIITRLNNAKPCTTTTTIRRHWWITPTPPTKRERRHPDLKTNTET